MPDIDLNRWSAEAVMGWISFTTFVAGKPVKFWAEKSALIYEQSAWLPLTDLNQCFMVVEKMRELGFNFCLICRQDGVNIACFTKEHNFSGEADETCVDPAITILKAAYKALEGQDR